MGGRRLTLKLFEAWFDSRLISISRQNDSVEARSEFGTRAFICLKRFKIDLCMGTKASASLSHHRLRAAVKLRKQQP